MNASVPRAHRVTVADRIIALATVVTSQVACYAVFSRSPARHQSELIELAPSVPVNILPLLDVVTDPPKRGHPLGKQVPSRWQRSAKIPKMAPPNQSPHSPKPTLQPSAPGGPASVRPPPQAASPAPSPAPSATAPEVTEVVGEGGAGSIDDVPFGVPWGTEDGSDEAALQQLAVRLYRIKLIGWVRQYFRLRGSGLSTDKLAQLRVKGQVQVGQDRRVVGYQMTPSGEPAFDAAARAALQAVTGEQLPPPPPNYPGLVQSVIHVTFSCAKDSCD
jgi:hypothetical protein